MLTYRNFMTLVVWISLSVLFIGTGCTGDNSDRSDLAVEENSIPFDKIKWSIKDGKNYTYRSQMMDAIVYGDTIRSLKKKAILDQLGKPDYYRTDSSYLHYRISEKSVGSFTLKTKTVIIKLNEEEGVEWIKIHE